MLTKFWQHQLAIPLLLFLLILSFFSPSIFHSESFAGSDFQQIHYPLLKFIVGTVHESGTLPLWNPHQFLGYSVVGNPQYGLFYPPNWLLLAFPGSGIYTGITLLTIAHVWCLGLGVFVLARQWQASPLGAFLAAGIVALGTYPASKIYAGHYAVILTMAWLPWLLAGAQHTLSHKHWRSILPGAAALGMAILAGHPQFVYIGLIGVAMLVIYHLWETRKGAWGRKLWHSLLMVFCGIILGAVTALPAYDYQSETVRGQANDSLDFANQHAIPPHQLASLIIPDVFGTPTTDTGYWGEAFYEEMTAYVGILPFLLLYSFLGRRRRTWLFAAMLIIGGLWLSLGADAGLYALLYYLVPPARGFRAPGRFLILTTIGLALLAALLLTDMQKHFLSKEYSKTFSRRVFLPTVIVLGGITLLLLFGDDALYDESARNDHIQRQLLYSAFFMAALASMIVAGQWFPKIAPFVLVFLALGNVWWAAAPLRNSDTTVALSALWEQADKLIPDGDDGQYGRIIQTGSPPGIINGASWTGHFSPQGYDPISPAGWSRLVEATGTFIQDPGSATNRLFGVRYVVAGQPLANYGFATAQYFSPINNEAPYYFYENPATLARVYVSGTYHIETDTESALTRIQAGEVDRGDAVLLPEDPNCTVSGDMGEASIIEYTPNRVRISAQSTGGGILVLSDQYDEDWRASVNGKPAPLLQINTTFRGVCLPDGEHVVEFSYRPRAFFVGAGLSAAAWVLWLGTFVYGRWRKPD